MKKIEKEAARRMLVRAPNWLGDAIMCVPAVKGLAAIFEPDELAVVARANLAGVFERYGFANKVRYVTRENSASEHKALAGSGYGVFFLFTNSFRSALDARATKCPVRVGYGGNFRGFLLTHVVPKTGKIHMVDYYLNLARPFGTHMFSQNADFPLLREETDFADGVDGLKGAIAIPLGAQYGRAKCWPHKNLKAFIKLVASSGGRRVVLFGTGSDVLEAESLESVAPKIVTNLAGKTTIGQMAAVMAKCDWVVANDSGPLHVAGALGVKTVALFGPTDPGRTAPMADCVRIISQNVDCSPCFKRECDRDHRCLNAITAEEIFAIITGEREVKFVPPEYE
jgi:heptosyltransferase-2